MIHLIVPCFNEAQRIQLDEFARYAGPEVRIVFADDGSTDGTATLIRDYIDRTKHPCLSLYSNPTNQGKGEIIRQAYLSLNYRAGPRKHDWIGFWDADLATPLFEIANMFTFNKALYNGTAESIWGSRLYRLGSHLERSTLRHYLGRLFATVIAILLKVESYDSQCGAKLFSARAAEVAFKDPFLSRWIFDVEILLRLKDVKIIEYPVLEWRDIPGSKIKVFKEALRIYTDILRIRKKYIRGTP